MKVRLFGEKLVIVGKDVDKGRNIEIVWVHTGRCILTPSRWTHYMKTTAGWSTSVWGEDKYEEKEEEEEEELPNDRTFQELYQILQ